MRRRYFWARHPEVAGGSVHHVQAVSSRVTPSPPSRCRAARSPDSATRFATALAAQKALSLLGKGLELRKLVAGAGFEPATSGLLMRKCVSRLRNCNDAGQKHAASLETRELLSMSKLIAVSARPACHRKSHATSAEAETRSYPVSPRAIPSQAVLVTAMVTRPDHLPHGNGGHASAMPFTRAAEGSVTTKPGRGRTRSRYARQPRRLPWPWCRY